MLNKLAQRVVSELVLSVPPSSQESRLDCPTRLDGHVAVLEQPLVVCEEQAHAIFGMFFAWVDWKVLRADPGGLWVSLFEVFAAERRDLCYG